MDKRIKRLIQELSQEHGISQYKAELIVMSEFQTIRDIISSGDLESIRLMHLGTFYVNQKKKYKIEEAKDAKNT